MQQPQQPKNSKKKRAKTARITAAAAALCAVVAAVSAGREPARAIVVATPPPGDRQPATSRTPTPSGTILPLDSSLFFVLDQPISSKLKAGSTARAHLRDAIVLEGKTIAAAGTPVDIEISEAIPAQMGNEDGSVDIYFKALRLADGREIPLDTPTAHIDPHVTVGQYNTQATVDTIGDIFIPGHYIYHMLRKGHDVVLSPGTVLRARTGASIMVAKGAIVVSTPQPFVTVRDTPHPAFSPAPFYTPPGFIMPTEKPSPTVHPSSTPH